MTGQCLVGVARDVQNLHVRACERELVRESAAAHTWHDYVRDEQMDWARMACHEPQRLLAVRRFQDVVPDGAQREVPQLADPRLVLDEQDRFGSTLSLDGGVRTALSRRSADSRQVNLKPR